MRRTQPKVNVIVHYPTTQEGKDALSKIVAEVHAEKAFNRIRKLNCPTEQKLQLLDAVVAKAREDAKKGNAQ